MKNVKIYRRATALVLATTITLLTGCTGKREETGTVESQETTQPVEFYLSDEQRELKRVDRKCRHAIVYFGGQAIVLRNCENYRITRHDEVYIGNSTYTISYDDVKIATWDTQIYNEYKTDHADLLAQIENEAIKNGAKVLKIKPQNSK